MTDGHGVAGGEVSVGGDDSPREALAAGGDKTCTACQLGTLDRALQFHLGGLHLACGAGPVGVLSHVPIPNQVCLHSII